MDWFQWLSQTSLPPSQVYNYSVLFACNELTVNDVACFDHDFLLSMGVRIGKHRLEILKLARSEAQTQTRHHNNTLSVKSLLSSARRGLVRCAKKLAGRKKEPEGGQKLSPLQIEWKEIIEEKKEEEEKERGVLRSGKVSFDGSRFLRSPGLMADHGEKKARSGPLGMKRVVGPVLGQRKYLSGPINGGRPLRAQKSPRLSGPLDDKLKSPMFSGPLDERFALNKSPRLSGQLDGCYGPECQSPWAMLFEDLRPN